MQLLVAERGDAVHLHDREAPVLEIRGQLHRIEGPPLEVGEARTLLRSIAPPSEFRDALTGCTVFEHQYSDSARFRVMAFREDGSIRLELRTAI